MKDTHEQGKNCSFLGSDWPIITDDNGVVTLEWLECDLFLGLHLLCLHLVNFGGKHGGRFSCGVNAAGLDGNDEVSTVLQEVVCVKGYDLSLIGLGDIGKDDINHTEKHAVLVWVTGILNDGNDVCSLLGNVDQITARTMRELNSVHQTLRADNIGHVGDCGSRGSSKIEDLGAWLDVNGLNTSENGSGQLGAEGVPCAVLNLLIARLNGDALLAVD